MILYLMYCCKFRLIIWLKKTILLLFNDKSFVFLVIVFLYIPNLQGLKGGGDQWCYYSSFGSLYSLSLFSLSAFIYEPGVFSLNLTDNINRFGILPFGIWICKINYLFNMNNWQLILGINTVNIIGIVMRIAPTIGNVCIWIIVLKNDC